MAKSLEQEPAVTLNFVTDMVEEHVNKRSQVAGNRKIRFDKEAGKRFQKFVSTILNDRNIKQVISRKFIETKSWKWIFKTSNDAKAESNFSSYILSEMENAIETHKFHFNIVYLNIQTPFTMVMLNMAILLPSALTNIRKRFLNINLTKNSTCAFAFIDR